MKYRGRSNSDLIDDINKENNAENAVKVENLDGEVQDDFNEAPLDNGDQNMPGDFEEALLDKGD